MLNDLQIKAPKAERVEYKLVDSDHAIAAGHKIVTLPDLTDASIVFDGLEAIFPAKVT